MTSGKFNILIVLSFIFISVSLFAQEMDAEAAKLFNQGNTQMKQGDYNAAINSYNSAINITFHLFWQKLSLIWQNFFYFFLHLTNIMYDFLSYIHNRYFVSFFWRSRKFYTRHT